MDLPVSHPSVRLRQTWCEGDGKRERERENKKNNNIYIYVHSGNLISYWKLPFIADLPIKNVDFP